jgi:hypothetical protein
VGLYLVDRIIFYHISFLDYWLYVGNFFLKYQGYSMEKLTELLLGMIIGFFGFYLIYHNSNLQMLLGIFLVLWGNNIAMKFNILDRIKK